MPYADKDDNEIRLFGEKSLREEAYHKKILQLERELADLETIAKSKEPAEDIKPQMHSKNANSFYYESLLSFDRKLKREQESLEKRATEITERLNLQAQHLLSNAENLFRKKVKWFFFIVVGFVLVAILFLAYSNMKLLPGRVGAHQPVSLNNKISYIKTALQTQTKYHYQYEVSSISILNGNYIVEIELDSASNDAWFYRNLSREVIKVFQRYSSHAPAEISFFRKGKLYIKAYLTDPVKKPRLQFFS